MLDYYQDRFIIQQRHNNGVTAASNDRALTPTGKKGDFESEGPRPESDEGRGQTVALFTFLIYKPVTSLCTPA